MNRTILTGRYQGSGRGFGFFIPENGTGRADDLFVPPHREGGAWDGDRVEAVLDGEDPHRPGQPLGRITKIIERGSPRVTGVARRYDHALWLYPDNERLPRPIKVTGRAQVRDGDRCAVEMTSYGTELTPPLGTLCAAFGPVESREAAVAAILYGQDISPAFPDTVLAEAGAVPQTVPVQALEGRLDLREKRIITIDGAASKDLDDAVSLERVGEHWLLGVHIADVSHYVTPGSALDAEALERGTSVYFADRVIPMLPVALSNGICSLNPGVDRLTLSCFMTLNRRGELVDHGVHASVIRSAERMTYDDCNALLRGENPYLAQRYAHILPMLRDMAALARVLEKNRRDRGGLDLDIQESYVVCDSMGEPVDIVARRQGESEKLIECFMLAANETVAMHLFDHRAPCVYRVHEKPGAEKVETLRAMLAPLGYSLRDAGGHSLQKVLDAARGTPEGPAVNMMVLRAMMKARYDGKNLGHFGIAADYYCHFTSPIRRYPDLMVHRCLHALLDGGRELKKLARAVPEAAAQSSRREVTAQTAERDIEKLYFAAYLREHIGEEFTATVSGVTRMGLFCALDSGVEGLLPTEALPDDRYAYSELGMSLTGERTGRKYTFGMTLPVVCVSADPTTGRIEFRLPGEPPKPAPAPAQKTERPREKKKPLPGKSRGNRRAVHVPKRGRKGKMR